MREKSTSSKSGAEKAVKDIRRANRSKFSAEEKIRILIKGLLSAPNRPSRIAPVERFNGKSNFEEAALLA